METENHEKQPSPVTSAPVMSLCRKKKNEQATFLEDLKDHVYEFINVSMDEHKACFKKIIQKFGMSGIIAEKNADSKGVENLVVQPTPPVLPTDDDALMRQMHEQWMVEYGRVYKGQLKEERFKIFKETAIRVNALNANSVSCTFGLNQFADLTEEELAHVC